MTEARTGQIETVQTQPGGTLLYTHGHRFPDNVQMVEQRHNAAGTLLSARVTWSGFVGRVLDVTATFDTQGRTVKEEGHRAPGLTTPVTALILPLPARAQQTCAEPGGS
ncbi:hypothetical protein HNQ07_000294 [Deinococcus metalli]|uniref:Uncharacterized protein n=1 Tax=Deinococcus metalli TaxID=1141878 RepID=A0A7W8KBG4_9DEIO|nr:hypothetical protein [Deinococcus metalli]MBB5374850.1 hypothetical protein [Deinococcus metalli]GHF33229.1 hypothetical protein GCM10017781_07480 [Deinococcus metalli]